MTTNDLASPGASAAAIQYHYDVGNDFYRLWLGSTFTYSGALWEQGDDLDTAQWRKIDYHIDQAGAANVPRVLDVGCGWGSTLQRLVQQHGVQHAVGLTLSRAQRDWVAALGDPRIAVRIENWMDHVPAAPYDAIISIGAFEHFARPELTWPEKIDAYRAFFRRCHGWLRPGGRMSLQTIAYGNLGERERSQFIMANIFPESDLPTLADITLASEGAFEVVSVRNDRHDYERTTRAWLQGVKQHRRELVALSSENVVARYIQYLSLAMIGFHTGSIQLLRLGLHRYDHPRKW